MLPTHIDAWVRRFCIANEWRVRPMMDRDDLYQECVLKYQEITQRYKKCKYVKQKNYFFRSCQNLVAGYAGNRTSYQRHVSALGSIVPTCTVPNGDGEGSTTDQLYEKLKDHILLNAADRHSTISLEQSLNAIRNRLDGQKFYKPAINSLLVRFNGAKIRDFLANNS